MKQIFYSIVLIILILGCQRVRETEIKIVKLGNLILVPVVFSDQTYMFVWDTGYSHSCISNALANKLGILHSDRTASVRVLRTKKESTHYYSAKTQWSIGGFCLKSEFILDDFNMYSNNLPVHIDGIIGGDIINQYYWFFDFANKNLRLSTKNIFRKEVEAMKLDFNKSPSRTTPYCTLTINDTISTMLLFDSGMDGTDSYYKNKSLCFDFSVGCVDTTNYLWSYFKTCQKINKVVKEENAIFESGRIIDSVKINGLELTATYITLDVDDFHRSTISAGSSGYITANFIRRFSQMYYDPFDKKIYFYKSDSDKGLYTGLEIEEFFRL